MASPATHAVYHPYGNTQFSNDGTHTPRRKLSSTTSNRLTFDGREFRRAIHAPATARMSSEANRASEASLQGNVGRMSSADGFFLRATRFAGSPARSGASCSGQKGGGNNSLETTIAGYYFKVEIQNDEPYPTTSLFVSQSATLSNACHTLPPLR